MQFRITHVHSCTGTSLFTPCVHPVGIQEDDDVASRLEPSKHPERRRIRLIIGANATGVASVLRFQDNPDEIVTDEGNAQGSLADAVWELLNNKLKAESKNN